MDSRLKYGYARVSTRLQASHGHSIEDQEAQLTANGCEEIVTEQFTGTVTQRPELDKLLPRLQDGDTLMVTKLDRLARTAADGSKLIAGLMERGVKVHILNMGLIDNTPTGRLIANVLLCFAEFEHDLIIERTQTGRAIARTKAGYREGRKPIPIERKSHAVSLIEQGMTYKEVVEITGLSRSTIKRAVRYYRSLS